LIVNEFVDRAWARHTVEQKIQRVDIWSDFAEQREPPLGTPRR